MVSMQEKIALNGSHFIQQVGMTFFTQMVCVLFSVANAAIVARCLGPEGKGLLALVLLIPNMLGIFLNGGIGIANVYLAGSGRQDISTLVTNSVTFACIATVIGIGVITSLIATSWLEVWMPGVPVWLLCLATLGFPTGILNIYFSTILQGLQHIAKINKINLLQAALTLCLTFLFVSNLGLGIVGALVAYLGAGSISVIIMGLILKQMGGSLTPTWNPKIAQITLLFGIKGHIGNVLQYFNYRLDMFFVNYFLGPGGVGIYSVSVGLAELLWYFPNAVGFVIFPKAASSKPIMMNIFTPRVFRLTFGLTAFGAILLGFIGKLLIEMIFSSSFNSAFIPMVALLPGVVFQGGTKVLANDIAGRGYPQYNSLGAGIGVILTVLMDLLLIPRYGVLGAALASTVAYGVIFLNTLCFHWIVSRRTETVHLGEL